MQMIKTILKISPSLHSTKTQPHRFNFQDVLVDHPDAGAVPITDGMDAKTFKPTHVGYGHRGVFDWNLRYQWLPLRPEDTKVPGAPYELACLTGGAYAIRREHFFHLGG